MGHIYTRLTFKSFKLTGCTCTVVIFALSGLRYQVNVLALCTCTKESIKLMRECSIDDGQIILMNRCVDLYFSSVVCRLFLCLTVVKSTTPVASSSYRVRLKMTQHVYLNWDWSVTPEKVACWSTKAAISLKHVNIEEKLLWRAYRNSPTLFRTVPSPYPYGLLFHRIGLVTPPKTSIAIISGTGKTTDFKFGRFIHRVHPNKNLLNFFGEKRDYPKFLSTPYYLRNG